MAKLAEIAGVTIRLEQVAPENDNLPITLDVDAVPLPEVLNHLLKLAPGYAWHQEGNGSILVASAGARVRPSQVQVDVVSTVRMNKRDVSQYIYGLPEVQRWAKCVKCEPMDVLSLSVLGRPRNRPGTEFLIEPVVGTLGNLLRNMAEQSGTRFWVIHVFEDREACRFNIGF